MHIDELNRHCSQLENGVRQARLSRQEQAVMTQRRDRSPADPSGPLKRANEDLHGALIRFAGHSIGTRRVTALGVNTVKAIPRTICLRKVPLARTP
jgi:hypothetical protein